MNKNRITTLAVAAILSFCALGPASVTASAGCTNKSLDGYYGFTIQGTKLGGLGFTGQQVGVAMAQFDGNGTFTQIDTVTVAGNVVSDFTHTPANGTYTVNSDCTGTFTINFTDGRPTVVANFVVVDSGNEIDTVVTSAGGAQGILATSSIGKKRYASH